jgi:hypothetical protein
MDSYLTNRKHCIVFQGIKYSANAVTSGVPQGSFLGPLLFNLYIADIPSIFQHTQCNMYSDDMKLFMRSQSQEDSENFQIDIDLEMPKKQFFFFKVVLKPGFRTFFFFRKKRFFFGNL